MRTFFAIDQFSSLKLSVIRKLLALRFLRSQYETLRLEAERFSCVRTDLDGLLIHAKHEGKKILDHYPDAGLCMVVFGLQTNYAGQPGSKAMFDCALALRQDRSFEWRLLNPAVGTEAHLFWESSPNLQPEFAETVLEMAEIHPHL